MTNYVIFNDVLRGLCGTTKENYCRNIRNKAIIQQFTNFENAEEVKNYLVKYSKIQPENIIIIN